MKKNVFLVFLPFTVGLFIMTAAVENSNLNLSQAVNANERVTTSNYNYIPSAANENKLPTGQNVNITAEPPATPFYATPGGITFAIVLPSLLVIGAFIYLLSRKK